MNNNRGYSITELMLAVAISGMVLLAFMDIMQFMRIMENRARIRADSRTTQSLGERYLWMGLKNAAPSFNNLPALDDTGRNFYDLNRDVATNAIAAANLTRTFTMSFASGKTTFMALLSETNVANLQTGAPDVMLLDPTRFYNISVGADPATTGLSWANFRSYIQSINPNFFGKGTQVIEVYVPSTFRNAGASVLSMPNSTSYFLRCPGGGGDCTTENFGGLVTYKNAQNTAMNVTSFDNFLKTIPAASGGIPPFLARVVRLVRYELRRSNLATYPQNVGDLYYTTWNGNGFDSPQLIADRVQSLVFQRPNITDPTITINLTPQDVNQRLGK